MFPTRFRLARKRAGLSMRQLAESMTPKVTGQAIGKYETGRMLPSSAVLVGLGKALGVSLDFLMGGPVEEIEEVEFRKHTGASARARAMAEAILIDSLERYLAIEHILDMRPDMGWVDARRIDSVADETQIDERARELRRSWDLGTDPIPSVGELLEDRGIKVVEADLPERISGLSCHVRSSCEIVADAVIVSSRINVERKRFTLAHAIAHRIIRSTGNPAIRIEAAMDRFAGAFLVPGERLIEETGRNRRQITYYEIIRIKHMYGVSTATVLMRLGQIGVLRPAAFRRAFRTFARSWRRSEPDPIGDQGFAMLEKPRRFQRLVARAAGDGLISVVRAAELLKQPLESVEQQISGPTNP